jgi:hypothetical protein
MSTRRTEKAATFIRKLRGLGRTPPQQQDGWPDAKPMQPSVRRRDEHGQTREARVDLTRKSVK